MLYDEKPGDCLLWKNQGQPITDIMQFTGLLDKNGKEIYEGDVVYDPSEYGGKKTVVWNSGLCCFEFDSALGYPLSSASKCEVIGNIYENPNLA